MCIGKGPLFACVVALVAHGIKLFRYHIELQLSPTASQAVSGDGEESPPQILLA